MKIVKNITKLLTACFAVSVIMTSAVFGESKANSLGSKIEWQVESEEKEFYESDDIIYNPDIGFYYAVVVKVTPLCITNLAEVKKAINAEPVKYNGEYSDKAVTNLVHLRMDISAFSATNSGGQNVQLTPGAVKDINEVLNTVRSKGKNAVIRFSYDPDFNSEKVNGHIVDVEPYDINLIMRHVEQICSIVSDYEDVITAVECGMLGPQGEMHSTSMAGNMDFILKVMDGFLTGLQKTAIPFLVRQPSFIYEYFKVNKIAISNSTGANVNSKEYKLGIYNDTFLSSPNDMNTYKLSREQEIDFLKAFTNHIPFGGEMQLYHNNDGTDSIALFDNPDKYFAEMHDLHLSYLNIGCNKEVLSHLHAESYRSYNGKGMFECIYKHMGYRFSFEKTKIIKSTDDTKLKTIFTIKNSGFANLPSNREKLVQLIFTDFSSNIPIKIITLGKPFTSTDKKRIVIESADNEIDISDLAKNKTYKIYVRICNRDESYPIRFANSASNWNETLKANYAGCFVKN